MSQHQALLAAPFQRFPLSLPISSFSTSTRSNHAGKPLWEHVACKGPSSVTFDTANFPGDPASGNAVVSCPVFKIVVDGAVHEEISLHHLARLAAIDARNGAGSNDNAAKLNLVVRSPLLALKYVSKQFEIRRFQVKFCTKGDDGFASALDNLRLFGLIARESDQTAKSKTLVQAATASIMPTSAQMSNSASNPPADAQISDPPIYRPIAPALPLASTQTQGQRIEVPCYPSQDVAQSQSIQMHDFSYRSQKRYPSINQPHFQTPAMSAFAQEALDTPSLLPAKEGPDSLASYTGLTDRLTDKPVGRRLSFTTPPSSGQQPPASAQSDCFNMQSDGHSPSGARPHFGAHALGFPGLQPSLLARPVNDPVPTERRPFFQRSSPLRNEVIVIPHQSDPSVPEPALSMKYDTEFGRPSTAPAYPGLLQETVAPPKRKLPFTSPKKSKKGSAAESQEAEDAEEVTTHTLSKTTAKSKATQQRPYTSPGDLDKASNTVENKKRAVKKAKTVATKKIQSKTTKAPDDATNAQTRLSKTTTPTSSMQNGRTSEGVRKQENVTRASHTSNNRSYQSAATQTSILSLNTSTTCSNQSTQVAKTPAVLAEVQGELDAKGTKVILLSSLLQTVDRFALDSNVTKAVEPTNSKGKAFEQKLCELLVDDRFLDLCDEVERACSRAGVVV